MDGGGCSQRVRLAGGPGVRCHARATTAGFITEVAYGGDAVAGRLGGGSCTCEVRA